MGDAERVILSRADGEGPLKCKFSVYSPQPFIAVRLLGWQEASSAGARSFVVCATQDDRHFFARSLCAFSVKIRPALSEDRHLVSNRTNRLFRHVSLDKLFSIH